MNRIAFRSLIVVSVLWVLLCVPSIASADPVTWTLSGVMFDDGGTASGSFVYDALNLTNPFSSINIMTFAGTMAGTPFTGTTSYLALSSAFTPLPNSIVVAPTNVSGDLTGTMVLDLELGASLPNSGGTAVSLFPEVAFEGLCADAGCDPLAITTFRFITAGEVVSPVVVPTPEPSVFLLLGMGLVCIVGATKRKVLQA